MFQRILVLMLLMMVEFSTVRSCFTSFKPSIEVQDIEDSNESEDASEDILVEKFFLSTPSFQFCTSNFLAKNAICDLVATSIQNPFRTIDSPPPKA
ncbi:hypothetical protein GCM10011514_24090 [Emticicia aquatilis]|uniref:Uncharacterized protein n=1 Tax=Emticicia aquatilis TaxID=1537369 RepID=A0A916YSN8_9BACT|nr:hypothetical protein [Emticicia aquatilis]GGD59318.1 hypothetical protein GCM10011514_24090 [Emticicia aquatilis]